MIILHMYAAETTLLLWINDICCFTYGQDKFRFTDLQSYDNDLSKLNTKACLSCALESTSILLLSVVNKICIC